MHAAFHARCLPRTLRDGLIVGGPAGAHRPFWRPHMEANVGGHQRNLSVRWVPPGKCICSMAGHAKPACRASLPRYCHHEPGAETRLQPSTAPRKPLSPLANRRDVGGRMRLFGWGLSTDEIAGRRKEVCHRFMSSSMWLPACADRQTVRLIAKVFRSTCKHPRAKCLTATCG